MKKYIEILKRNQLFSGVSEENIEAMLNCLSATFKDYKKGEYIFRQGEYIENICILISGCVHIQSDDYWGNRSIISEVSSSEMFGESYAVHGSSAVLNDAVATADSTVAFFNVKRLMTVCSSACTFHSTVIQNLLIALTHKNRNLMQKLTHISKRTTREKLISYLSNQSKLAKSNSFSIPFNRQQLADFLSVDRSAMSNELCKMRDEGLIIFEKSNFTLL
ncbi:MAG: Crp/Fnr family transcriptional regulator [Ruminococcaceae bacterium]|nr:Crp/Fnr family transcriptional regulator [Oscillospiraceae bacterium]